MSTEDNLRKTHVRILYQFIISCQYSLSPCGSSHSIAIDSHVLHFHPILWQRETRSPPSCINRRDGNDHDYKAKPTDVTAVTPQQLCHLTENGTISIGESMDSENSPARYRVCTRERCSGGDRWEFARNCVHSACHPARSTSRRRGTEQ